jgi:hypothetical protein
MVGSIRWEEVGRKFDTVFGTGGRGGEVVFQSSPQKAYIMKDTRFVLIR